MGVRWDWWGGLGTGAMVDEPLVGCTNSQMPLVLRQAPSANVGVGGSCRGCAAGCQALDPRALIGDGWLERMADFSVGCHLGGEIRDGWGQGWSDCVGDA